MIRQDVIFGWSPSSLLGRVESEMVTVPVEIVRLAQAAHLSGARALSAESQTMLSTVALAAAYAAGESNGTDAALVALATGTTELRSSQALAPADLDPGRAYVDLCDATRARLIRDCHEYAIANELSVIGPFAVRYVCACMESFEDAKACAQHVPRCPAQGARMRVSTPVRPILQAAS